MPGIVLKIIAIWIILFLPKVFFSFCQAVDVGSFLGFLFVFFFGGTWGLNSVAIP
jgi:hypothetical protein